MLVENSDGLPQGNTEDPILITSPRHGIPHIIDTSEALEDAAHTLRSVSSPTAIDAERAQGFRYGSDPYLIQIRKEGAPTCLIDTHALPDLSILADSINGTWILHDAEQDLPNLRQVGLAPSSLFDTFIAARLLGNERFSLVAVCEDVLGLTLAKDHQASDWSVRPLPTGWLRYAALDVELLNELFNKMTQSLHRLGRDQWAEEEFTYVLSRPAPTPKPDKWRSISGIGRLRNRRELAVLRELWNVREKIAQDLNIAPGRFLRNSALLRAAQTMPRNRTSLRAIGEFRSPRARQYTDAWLDAIDTALVLPDDQLPLERSALNENDIPQARQWTRMNPDGHARLQAVREAVSGVAQHENIHPEAVLEPRVQRAVSWTPLPDTPSILDALDQRLIEAGARTWQRELVRQPIAEALS